MFQVDTVQLKEDLGGVVRRSAEDTLNTLNALFNTLSDAEADRLNGAKRFEHSPYHTKRRGTIFIWSIHASGLPPI